MICAVCFFLKFPFHSLKRALINIYKMYNSKEIFLYCG